MVTAFLIFFALVLEYVYDPISNMKDTAVIDTSFLKFKNYLKNYELEKSYVYLSFPIVVFLIFSVLVIFGLVFFAIFFWEIPAPQKQIEKNIEIHPETDFLDLD